MVNTFIIESSFIASAANLDGLRLKKQCVEAHQLHNIISHLKKICELEGWKDCVEARSVESSFKNTTKFELHRKRVAWAIQTRKRYLELDYRYAKIDGKFIKFPKSDLPFKLYTSHNYELKGDIVELILPERIKGPKKYIEKTTIETKRSTKILYKIHKKDCAFETDEIMSLGFSQHAAVKMWAGYLNCLGFYINVHLDEYTKRTGNTMNIPRHDVSVEIAFPWWNNTIFFESHRASLIRKEIKRNEKPHYVNLYPKKDGWMELGYAWPSNVCELDVFCEWIGWVDGVVEAPTSGINKIHKFCVEITSDDKPKKPKKSNRV